MLFFLLLPYVQIHAMQAYMQEKVTKPLYPCSDRRVLTMLPFLRNELVY